VRVPVTSQRGMPVNMSAVLSANASELLYDDTDALRLYYAASHYVL